jgi:hypothetical protein
VAWENLKSIKIKGNFKLLNLKWGRLISDRPYVGHVDINAESVRLVTDDESFILDTFINPAQARIKRFYATLGNSSSIDSSGEIDFKLKNINLNIQGNNIPPDAWPPLVERYPEISGALNFNGLVKGKLSHPQADLNIEMKDIVFKPNGEKWNGKTILSGNKDSFLLHDTIIDGGYSGKLQWTRGENKGTWFTEINFDEASPQLLADILKYSERVKGHIKGFLGLNWTSSYMSGASDLSWNEGGLGPVSFDRMEFKSLMDPEKMQIKEFDFYKGSQVLKIQGDAVRKQKKWDFETVIQAQRVGGQVAFIDGELLTKGTIDPERSILEAKLSTPVLLFSDNPLENIFAQLKIDKAGWMIIGYSSDKKNNFQIESNFKSRNLKGLINLTSLSIENIAANLFPAIKKRRCPSWIF